MYIHVIQVIWEPYVHTDDHNEHLVTSYIAISIATAS